MTADPGGAFTRRRALALTRGELGDEPPGAANVLLGLCRAVTRDLGLAGATVTLIPGVGSHAVAAASSIATRRLEELQFDTGEGPTREAFFGCKPVIAADPASLEAHWPGYVPAALASGVSAVYALPLHVGDAKLGALTLYWQDPRRPVKGDLRSALVFADLAAEILIDESYSGPGRGPDAALTSSLDTHATVYQAQGMVMLDLGVGLPEALARMRALAYAAEQGLAGLAGQIIDGETVVPRDPE